MEEQDKEPEDDTTKREELYRVKKNQKHAKKTKGRTNGNKGQHNGGRKPIKNKRDIINRLRRLI